jgi:hypothetical protein
VRVWIGSGISFPATHAFCGKREYINIVKILITPSLCTNKMFDETKKKKKKKSEKPGMVNNHSQ